VRPVWDAESARVTLISEQHMMQKPHSEQKKNNQTGMAKNELLTYTKG
jgi:hypothetical protein